jgi:hypothetical protein
MPLEQWTLSAQLCSYCGCVYAADDNGTQKIHGHYDNSLIGRGWRPGPLV